MGVCMDQIWKIVAARKMETFFRIIERDVRAFFVMRYLRKRRKFPRNSETN